MLRTFYFIVGNVIMISKEIQQFLKEKKLKDNGLYFISFIEEFWMPGADIFGGKIRKDIGDFHAGRIEIWADSYEYDIEELRFFTKDPSFAEFRNDYDFKDVNAKTLDKIERINKKLYQKE